VHAYRATACDEVRLLSVGGAAEAVKAVLSGLRTSGQLTLLHRTARTDPRRPTRSLCGSLTFTPDSPSHLPSRQLIRRLPCGAAHGLLYTDPAPTESPDRFALLLPESQRADAARFLLHYLDARTTLPLHPSWATWLWHLFDAECYLEPLLGAGPWIGWDVSWSEAALGERLREAIATRELTIA
jgi:hypothetical protein